MEKKVHYGTITEAIESFKKQGFTHDFNIEDDCLRGESEKFNVEDLEIVDLYRYEGDTDPSDEATVYAIASKNGIKGILVTGYSANADSNTTGILSRLSFKK